MKFKSVYSTQSDAQNAVAELQEKLGNFKAKVILFFASSHFDPSTLSQKMEQAFQDSIVVGCTTAGEITSGKMLDQSLVALAMSEEAIANAKLEILENVQTDEKAVDKAFGSFAKYWGTSMEHLNPAEYVGIVLMDGLSGCEERINERIGDLTNVTFIGGSAGDDLQFKHTYVYANGKAYENVALLLMLKPSTPFTFLKTQSFQSSGKVLTVTEHNEERREISKLNQQPAAVAYAEALGVTTQELPDAMFKNPLGLMFTDSEPFVRSPRVIEGDSILFYCNVKEGMDLHLLYSTDIITDTKAALDQKKRDMGKIGAIINFNCILRTLDLKQQERTQDYGGLFADTPTVGFSTYGESYIGHINQTATMLLFKE